MPTNIGKGDQFKDEFLKISPNNRMPAMVDDAPADGGAPISVFELGAIMMYLAEKAGRLYPQDLRARYEVDQWVLWQMANQGPKLGECGHFRRLGDRQGDQSYAVRRFTDEANRLWKLCQRTYRTAPPPRRCSRSATSTSLNSRQSFRRAASAAPSHRRRWGEATLRTFVTPESELRPLRAKTGEGMPQRAIVSSGQGCGAEVSQADHEEVRPAAPQGSTLPGVRAIACAPASRPARRRISG